MMSTRYTLGAGVSEVLGSEGDFHDVKVVFLSL